MTNDGMLVSLNLRPRSDLLSRRYPHVPNRLLLPFCGHVRPPWEGRCIDLYRTATGQHTRLRLFRYGQRGYSSQNMEHTQDREEP